MPLPVQPGISILSLGAHANEPSDESAPMLTHTKVLILRASITVHNYKLYYSSRFVMYRHLCSNEWMTL
jgi:hypothetical protein